MVLFDIIWLSNSLLWMPSRIIFQKMVAGALAEWFFLFIVLLSESPLYSDCTLFSGYEALSGGLLTPHPWNLQLPFPSPLPKTGLRVYPKFGLLFPSMFSYFSNEQWVVPFLLFRNQRNINCSCVMMLRSQIGIGTGTAQTKADKRL